MSFCIIGIYFASETHIETFQAVSRNSVDIHMMELRQIVVQQAELNNLLNRLHALIGYGGLIHTFKNYVIRGEDGYKAKYYILFNEFNSLLRQMEYLPGLNNRALEQVAVIEDTMKRYLVYRDTIEKMRLKGKSVLEVDRSVRVDDGPAFAAIEYLRNNVNKIDEVDWWNTATQRMDQYTGVGKVIEKDIRLHLQQRVNASSQAIINYILLTVALMIVVLFCAYYLLRHVLGRLSRIRPEMLEVHGLLGGLQNVIDNWSDKTGLSCSMNHAGDLETLSDEVNLTVYRVIQEALTNVSRHAHADHVEIDLARTLNRQGEEILALVIQDDGVGMDLMKPNMQGLSMMGIADRINAMNGECEFTSSADDGIRITISIPLNSEKP